MLYHLIFFNYNLIVDLLKFISIKKILIEAVVLNYK